MEPVRLLSQLALSKRWHKSPRKIKAWTDLGILPTFVDPESDRVMYPLAAIERWEASHADRIAS